MPQSSPNWENTRGDQLPEAATRATALLTIVAVALALWIFWTTVMVARTGWVAIPVLDDWDRWLTYVSDHGGLGWLFREHVDHRLVTTKLLLQVDHLVFHGRGWFILLCSFCLQALTGFMLWWLSGRAYRQNSTERILLAAVIASCLFSAQQWFNFIFPFQVQFPMVYCAAAASLFALWKCAERGWKDGVPWFTGSILLAIFTTYTMANGILLWPVLLVAAVWMRMPRRWILAIAASALFIGVSYFYSWRPSDEPGPTALSERLPRAIVFMLGHLGSPVVTLAVRGGDSFRVTCAVIPGTLLALTLLAQFLMLWRRREKYNTARAMLIFYCVFLAGTSATIAWGRSGTYMLGLYQTRYLTPSYLFWAAMFLSVWPILRRAPRTALYGVLCAAMLVGVAIHQGDISAMVRDRASMERLGGIAVVDNVTDPEAWLWLYHTPSIAMDAIDYMRLNHLTVFSEEWTHWPHIPLNRRFSIDRTSGACEGDLEKVMPVPSLLRPGWRATGWAWDNKAGKSPRYIVLADDTGLIRGVALTGFPVPPSLAALPQRYIASTWNGYIDGKPSLITAYAVEADERSLCAIGKQNLRIAGTEIPFTQLGPRLPESPSQIAGGWTPDGYFKGTGAPGGPPPVEGPVLGTFPDANTGSIHLGPFHLDGHTEIAIPLVTGPDNHNLSVVVRDATTKEVLSQLTPPPIRITWWAWHPDLPQDRELTVEIVAEDKGSGWGQWLALGWPHTLQPPSPVPAR